MSQDIYQMLQESRHISKHDNKSCLFRITSRTDRDKEQWTVKTLVREAAMFETFIKFFL